MDRTNGRGRILIVDHTIASINLLKDVLQSEGYEVLSTDSGEIAVHVAALKKPDLVLCDLRMPDVNGLEICRRLKAHVDTRDIPFMFLSGTTSHDMKVEGFAAGALDFVSKPFHRNELLARIQTHLDLSRLRNRLERRVEERTQELDVALDALQASNAKLEAGIAERTFELEKSNDQLRRSLRHLMKNETLASLGSLVAGISHELNTPIGNCLMTASSLSAKTAAFSAKSAGQSIARSELQEYVHDCETASALIERNTKRAAELIDRFKLLASGQLGDHRREFNLLTVVEEVFFGVSPTLKKASVTVRMHIPNEIVMDSFPGLLVTVLTNLIDNALRHAFAKDMRGEIAVVAEHAPAEQIRLAFSDNGRGISQDSLPHVFEPFFTSQLGQGGSGLGLSMVFKMVTDGLGGEIDVSNLPDGGACFTLLIPKQAPSLRNDIRP